MFLSFLQYIALFFAVECIVFYHNISNNILRLSLSTIITCFVQKKLFIAVSGHNRPNDTSYVGFFLDIASVNSRVLYSCKNINSPIPRRKFGIIIGKELIIPHMKRRLLQERLPREIPQIIKRILGDNTVEATQEISSNPNKRRRCYVCPSSKDTKYSNICSVCKKTVCKTHGVQVSKCVNCMDTE